MMIWLATAVMGVSLDLGFYYNYNWLATAVMGVRPFSVFDRQA